MGEVEADGKEIQRVFKHIKCSVEAEEAEEVSSTAILSITYAIKEITMRKFSSHSMLLLRSESNTYSEISMILQQAR
jgi:hypothetical protein